MILTQSYLRTISASKNLRFSSDSQQQVLNENTQIFKTKNKFDLFLSHSSLDKELIYTLVNLFNISGYSVYVDWIFDTQLDRSQVTKKTAEVLKTRINSSSGLAYIATNNSSQSNWCRWELGYGDGKINGRCAILPVLETSSSVFRGQEYLGLYPYLQYTQISGSLKYDFWVYDNENPEYYVILSQWLKGANPTKH
jgi:hypothetical protein